jgi:PAS domain S-box-containing protein
MAANRSLRLLAETIERLLELDEQDTARQRERMDFLSLMDAVIEALPDALVVSNFQGEIVLFNGQAELMFGYHRSEVVGQKIECLLPQRLRDRHARDRELFSRYRVSRRTMTMGIGLNLVGLHKDGHEFPTEITLSRMVVPTGVFNLAVLRFVPDNLSRAVVDVAVPAAEDEEINAG